MNVAIKVENLSKKYIIQHEKKSAHYETLSESLIHNSKNIINRITHPFSKSTIQQPTQEEFWALKDINFEINQGDKVGIIGRNGAGKSTLLKILSRITEPTSGKIHINGRIASLLEVGTGFHPELTGAENIYLNGAILGMKRQEIKNKFDEIVAFAEVEKFLDTPVKRYSSGMYVRLAFAVAAHLEPEILIVDEVLAVGDMQFQKKCLGKIGDVSKEGRTVLFVSHNMAALKSLCDKAIWLQAGSVIENGLAEQVVSNYLQNDMSVNMNQVWNDPENAPGNNNVRLHSVKISSENEHNSEFLTVATPINLEFEFWNFIPEASLNFSMVLYNTQDVCIFNTGSSTNVYALGKVKGVCHIPENFLNDGIYRVRLLIVKDRSIVLVDFDNIALFEVHDVARDGAWYGKWIGAVRPKFDWETCFIG